MSKRTGLSAAVADDQSDASSVRADQTWRGSTPHIAKPGLGDSQVDVSGVGVMDLGNVDADVRLLGKRFADLEAEFQRGRLKAFDSETESVFDDIRNHQLELSNKHMEMENIEHVDENQTPTAESLAEDYRKFEREGARLQEIFRSLEGLTKKVQDFSTLGTQDGDQGL
eukprot:m.101803 g.101803  ORF g.101803 m.101803 type:complete len:169 (-) comp15668_c0_seq1:1281-1787(-)